MHEHGPKLLAKVSPQTIFTLDLELCQYLRVDWAEFVDDVK